MVRQGVAFDTNSYRQLVLGKKTAEVASIVYELKEKEKSKNIKAFGIMAVGMEMLGNLADESSVNFNDCLNGCIAMAYHCNDESNDQISIIPPPALSISKAFFNVVPPVFAQQVQNMIGVVQDLKFNLPAALKHHRSNKTFKNIQTYIEAEEDAFCLNLITLIEGIVSNITVKSASKSTKHTKAKILTFIDKEFDNYYSLATMYWIASQLKSPLTDHDLFSRAVSLKEEFPLAAGFHRWIAKKIIKDNIDMLSKASQKKRWNWNWDFQVAYVLSNHTIANRKMLLVTSDKDLTAMITDFGYQDRVLTLDNYLSMISN